MILKKKPVEPPAGDLSNELIVKLMNFGNSRLKVAVHKSFDNHARLHRWITEEDLFQEVMLRLIKACRVVDVNNTLHLYHMGLNHLRLSIIDFYRQLYGKNGWASNIKTDPKSIMIHNAIEPGNAKIKSQGYPVTLDDWIDFHESVQLLDPKEKETFDLIYYGGLNPMDVSILLNVSERTIRRRYADACEFFKTRMQKRHM